MWFLFFQIWLWLLASFFLGWLAHWFFCCRNKEEEASSSVNSNTALGVAATQTAEASPTPGLKLSTDQADSLEISDDWKPMLFSEAPAQIDDLKQIKGVGQVLEGTLQSLGVYQFKQVAEWTDEHVAWMDNFLSFTGRIDREDWRSQAKTLAEGGKTEFANRVEKGDVEY